jgi:hypothetical protein
MDESQGSPTSDSRRAILELLPDANHENSLTQLVSFCGSGAISATHPSPPLNIMSEAKKRPDYSASRRPQERWTSSEDRLLHLAVEHHGVQRWARIAGDVGGGRTRSQCAQRWTRVVNPKLRKGNWSFEEEEKLIASVQIHGTKAWGKVARDLETRPDVQCRFRWIFLQKKAAERGDEVRPMSPTTSPCQGAAAIQ